MNKSMNNFMNKIMQIPHSHATNWILAYDIREPRRLQKVGRFMQKEGMRLQYSVYMLKGSRDQ
ncbi:MAG: CRISPR-associated endonuclease Cas2, partial [Rhodoferax sp.]|nr:CRISPR-associated endonuclease Cas2 [Rhodoferax sp.]